MRVRAGGVWSGASRRGLQRLLIMSGRPSADLGGGMAAAARMPGIRRDQAPLSARGCLPLYRAAQGRCRGSGWPLPALWVAGWRGVTGRAAATSGGVVGRAHDGERRGGRRMCGPSSLRPLTGDHLMPWRIEGHYHGIVYGTVGKWLNLAHMTITPRSIGSLGRCCVGSHE